jgi:hypothetical protein
MTEEPPCMKASLNDRNYESLRTILGIVDENHNNLELLIECGTHLNPPLRRILTELAEKTRQYRGKVKLVCDDPGIIEIYEFLGMNQLFSLKHSKYYNVVKRSSMKRKQTTSYSNIL